MELNLEAGPNMLLFQCCPCFFPIQLWDTIQWDPISSVVFAIFMSTWKFMISQNTLHPTVFSSGMRWNVMLEGCLSPYRWMHARDSGLVRVCFEVFFDLGWNPWSLFQKMSTVYCGTILTKSCRYLNILLGSNPTKHAISRADIRTQALHEPVIFTVEIPPGQGQDQEPRVPSAGNGHEAIYPARGKTSSHGYFGGEVSLIW